MLAGKAMSNSEIVARGRHGTEIVPLHGRGAPGMLTTADLMAVSALPQDRENLQFFGALS